MNIETARPGLAHIMAELGAISWREDNEGFIVSVKISGRHRCRNYLVRHNDLVPIESELSTGTNPLRVRAQDFTRLADSDCR
jgi:hypothetical protein